MGVPRTYRKSREMAIASYNYTDIASGEGISTFKLSVGEDNSWKEYLLLTNSLITAISTGKLSTNSVRYEFRTNDFNLPRQVQGNAFFSGYVDNTASGYIIKTTLYKEAGELSLDGVGDINWSDATESTYNNTGAYVLIKTFNTTYSYLNKFEIDMKVTGGGGDRSYIKCKWIYLAGDYSENATSTTSGTYATKPLTNPNRNRQVKTLEIYGKVDSGTGHYKNMNVYEENTSGLTTTALSSEITSPTLSAEGGILLKIPLTKTIIKKGERILLRTEPAGTGGLIVDPTQEHNTEETAKINIPFNLDL